MKRIRLACFVLAIILMNASRARAYDGWDSELSHVAGSAVIAGAVTAISSHYDPPNRAWWGFAVSVTVGFLGETTSGSFSWLDVGSDFVGAAMGAFVTDKYILKPVVIKTPEKETYVGLVVGHHF